MISGRHYPHQPPPSCDFAPCPARKSLVNLSKELNCDPRRDVENAEDKVNMVMPLVWISWPATLYDDEEECQVKRYSHALADW
jgi:hypothetical protein